MNWINRCCPVPSCPPPTQLSPWYLEGKPTSPAAKPHRKDLWQTPRHFLTRQGRELLPRRAETSRKQTSKDLSTLATGQSWPNKQGGSRRGPCLLRRSPDFQSFPCSGLVPPSLPGDFFPWKCRSWSTHWLCSDCIYRFPGLCAAALEQTGLSPERSQHAGWRKEFQTKRQQSLSLRYQKISVLCFTWKKKPQSLTFLVCFLLHDSLSTQTGAPLKTSLKKKSPIILRDVANT